MQSKSTAFSNMVIFSGGTAMNPFSSLLTEYTSHVCYVMPVSGVYYCFFFKILFYLDFLPCPTNKMNRWWWIYSRNTKNSGRSCNRLMISEFFLFYFWSHSVNADLNSIIFCRWYSISLHSIIFRSQCLQLAYSSSWSTWQSKLCFFCLEYSFKGSSEQLLLTSQEFGLGFFRKKQKKIGFPFLKENMNCGNKSKTILWNRSSRLFFFILIVNFLGTYNTQTK
jgi:hypothetical protein